MYHVLESDGQITESMMSCNKRIISISYVIETSSFYIHDSNSHNETHLRYENVILITDITLWLYDTQVNIECLVWQFYSYYTTGSFFKSEKRLQLWPDRCAWKNECGEKIQSVLWRTCLVKTFGVVLCRPNSNGCI